MTGPPIDLDDPAAVCRGFSDIPMRVRPRHMDLVIMAAPEGRQATALMLVDDIPDSAPRHLVAQSLGRLWRHLRTEMPDPAVAVAICRAGTGDPTGNDLARHDAIIATARTAGVTCTGVYLATPRETVRLLPRAA